jgi:hypothetical protein
MDDAMMFPLGVKGHVVSMQTNGWVEGKPAYSLAVCECGWSNTVSWGEHEVQDRAIHAHWKEHHKCS